MSQFDLTGKVAVVTGTILVSGRRTMLSPPRPAQGGGLGAVASSLNAGQAAAKAP
jgi:hypothetical protein